MPDPSSDQAEELSPRRRRLMFRATHRGTKESDLLVGGFVRGRIATLTDPELDALEEVLELPDVDLADWLSGRRPVPEALRSPMLMELVEACGRPGAGIPEKVRPRA
ncbi:succinate dehydrogenase assembly factor 2 [Roseomonas sp. CCTCC AB2023176]|uniref:succinate dehydrogenase assembly factor 2 n=1 Tax=Roseomonas sp. CCTCC AB2023176 TaxID=3342640 RepID=UPI0035E30897